MSATKWEIDLSGAIGSTVRIETRDGIYLEGVLTGVETVSFVMNGEAVEMPTCLTLDNDPGKGVDIPRLATVDVLADEEEDDGEEDGEDGEDGDPAVGEEG